MNKPLKIAIGVQGRFHAFDLAKALLDRGHAVTIFTNYPKWAVARFGFPADRVRSFWAQGVAARLGDRLHNVMGSWDPGPRLHSAFGRWLAAEVGKENWDIIHGWSSVSEEHLGLRNCESLRLVVRGSAHIRTQHEILLSEQTRTGSAIDLPSGWTIQREEREYQLADKIVVLSTFAYDSFSALGFDKSKLALLRLGANTSTFRPSAEVVEARCSRIVSGAPLRVLYVGAISFQKGIHDLARVMRALPASRFAFKLVGPIATGDRRILAEMKDRAEFVAKRPQNELPDWYSWGDVFVFPTLQDGFAVVLAQANASALPILTTTNCCGPDLVEEGRTGWVLPIRNAEAFIERLLWCDSHREELAEMVRQTYYDYQPRDWADVAADFENICTAGLAWKGAAVKAAHGK